VVADTIESISIICVLFQLLEEVHSSPTFIHRTFA
jgi:hypothetical protein